MSGGRDAVYFISDAHFGLDADERVKTGRFAELIAQMCERATDVFIVGDLFDFWIEYKSAIRRDSFLVLHELRKLAEVGVRVHYVAGNHDFAIGSFLDEVVGVTVYHGCLNVERQGRKIHISHGDRVGKSSALRTLDVLLRNRFLQALYKLVHPDIGINLGWLFSAVSKDKHRYLGITPKDLKKYRRAAQARLALGKSDLVVFAHTHHADLVSFEEGDYCNTGSWIDNYDYAVMRDGKISQLTWITK
jgi:UDP-2,3-diacylglucosamine hydrolase